MLNTIFLRLGKLIAGFAFIISPMALALPLGLLDNNHPAVQARRWQCKIGHTGSCRLCGSRRGQGSAT